jgi:hypothetical protein
MWLPQQFLREQFNYLAVEGINQGHYVKSRGEREATGRGEGYGERGPAAVRLNLFGNRSDGHPSRR